MDDQNLNIPDFSVIMYENLFESTVNLISDILEDNGISKETIDISLIKNMVNDIQHTEQTIKIIVCLWTKWRSQDHNGPIESSGSLISSEFSSNIPTLDVSFLRYKLDPNICAPSEKHTNIVSDIPNLLSRFRYKAFIGIMDSLEDSTKKINNFKTYDALKRNVIFWQKYIVGIEYAKTRCCFFITNCLDRMNNTYFVECIFICNDSDFEFESTFDKVPFFKMMQWKQFDNCQNGKELPEYFQLALIRRSTYTFENENQKVLPRFQSVYDVF